MLVKFGLTVARNRSRLPVRQVVAATIQKLRFVSSTPQNRCSRNGESLNSSGKMESKEELRARLTPLQYQITQEAGTERPYSGCYNKHYEKGIYRCIVCHQDLFSSDTKYDSGCGWPAFNDVLDNGKVTLHKDASIPGMLRTEVRCSKCSAHMGHVFDDGPGPKGLRYCINSASLDFVSAEKRIRTEVRCAKCGAHMGHVFGDGPKPTGKRYCINSGSLEFVSAEELNSALKR